MRGHQLITDLALLAGISMGIYGSRRHATARSAAGWQPVWEGASAGDRNELYRLYVRVPLPMAAH